MGMQTIVLKLHKPSKMKREIIDDALLNYNMAFNELLSLGLEKHDLFDKAHQGKTGRRPTFSLSKWLDKDVLNGLNRFNIQPFKDSLKMEIGMATANDNWWFQTNTVQDKKLRPIYFCRYDIKRNFCLLYDRTKDRFYAKLYLLNKSNARNTQTGTGTWGRLIHIQDNSLLERKRGLERFIIVPLSFGKRQEKILKKAAIDPDRFKTARLIKKHEEYFLAVTLRTPVCENIVTQSYLGVSRGLKNKLNYTLVDAEGNILAKGDVPHFDSKGVALDEKHRAANFVTELAVRHKSQVIVQKFQGKGDMLAWTDDEGNHYRSCYGWRDYNHFVRLLNYKLGWKSLPQPVPVSSFGTFYTCPGCKYHSRGNRLSKDFFICIRCGTAIEIDLLGSLNLARRLLKYKASKIKIKIDPVDGGIVLTNKFLGLHFFCSDEENAAEKLKYELQQLMERVKMADTSINKKVSPTVKNILIKLLGAEDFMDMVEYV